MKNNRDLLTLSSSNSGKRFILMSMWMLDKAVVNDVMVRRTRWRTTGMMDFMMLLW